MSTISNRIHLDAPNVGELEKDYLSKAIDAGYVSTIGPFVPEFEESFAAFLGTKKAVSTQSGTAAIHLALHELKIGRGDEVIVPALTFIATVNPITYVGATPVFVDADKKTWNIDPADIERKITDRTRAIIPVHLYGNPCDMKAITKIARKYNLFIIEDSTESLGAEYDGKFTGTLGDLGCFSFNGNKLITTGGGGMVAGSNNKRLDHIKFLVNQAKDASKEYYHPEIGFNDRMTNIEAALGLAQLERLEEFLRRKKNFNRIYRDELSGLKIISFQEEYENSKNACWLTCISFNNGIDIDKLRVRLKAKGVPTRRVFMPVVEFPPYKARRRNYYKNSYEIYAKSLCLPSSTLNSENDIYRVCRYIREAI